MPTTIDSLRTYSSRLFNLNDRGISPAALFAATLAIAGCSAAKDIAVSPSTSSTAQASGSTKLVFSAPTAAATAGSCSGPFVAALVDGTGTSAKAAADVPLSLVVNGSGSFYGDSSCSAAVGTTTITAGQSSVSVYFKSSVAGFVLAYANSAIYGVASLPFKANPAAAGSLSVSGPASLSVGGCSTAYTVNLIDAFANAVTPGTLTTVSLAGASAGSFYSNSACSTSITTVNIPAGSNSAVFYFKDTSAEILSVTAASAGLSVGSLSLNIAASGGGGGGAGGTPAKLLLSAGANSTATGTCYGPVTAAVVDASTLSAVAASNTAVTLAGNGAGTYYSDNTCTTSVTSVTIATGTGSKVFYFKDQTAENVLFSATAAGLTASTFPFGALAGSPTRLAISGATTLGAGTCSSAFTATLQDVGNNTAKSVGTTTVNLTGAGAGTFFSDSGCTTSVTALTIASSASSASYYLKDATAQSLTLSAAAAGLTSGTLGVTVTGGVAAKLVLSLPASPTAGLCSQAIVINAQDLNSNVATVAAPTTVNLAGANHGTFYSDAGCTTSATSVSIGTGASTISFYALDITAELLSLSTFSAGFVSGTGALTVGPNALNKLAVSGSATLNASTCSAAITVTTQDTYANASSVASNFTVNLTGAGAGGVFYSDNACATSVTSVTVATGTSSQVFYYKTTNAGSPVLTAGGTGVANGSLTVTVTGLAANRLAITGPASIAVNACSSAYTMTSKDSANNITNVSANTPLTLSGGQGVFYTDSGCTTPVSNPTINSGTSAITVYYKDNSGEVLTLSAAAAGLTSGTLSVTQTAPSLTNVSLLAGTYSDQGGNDSATPTLQRFVGANGIITDGTRLYVSDRYAIHVATIAGGAWSTFVGSISSGGSADGVGTSASFSIPTQMTILGANMYVADYNNHTIRKIDIASGTVTTLAGVPGAQGYTDGSGAGARFRYPRGITNDGTSLFVSDQNNHCIRKVTTAGVVTTLTGACGSGGATDSATPSSVQFNNPSELVAVGAYLYVADYSNHAIRQVTIATGATVTFAGQMGANGTTDAAGTSARFYQPNGISSDGTNLYVAENNNNAIRRIVLSSATVTLLAGNFQKGFADGIATIGKLSTPSSTAVTGGVAYVLDSGNGMVRAVNLASGNMTTFAGPAASLMARSGGLGGQDGVGPAANFNNAMSAVEVNGYLYVADLGNHKIRRIALGTGATISFVGSGANGYQDGSYAGSRFYNPTGITSDGTRLFVADQSNHCIRQIVIANGAVTTLAGSCTNAGNADNASPSLVRFNNPFGITIDAAKTNLYVTDQTNCTIRKIVISTGATSTFAGGSGGSNDGTGATAQFNNPQGITTDGTNLYVADNVNATIRQVTLSGGAVTTIAGAPGARGLVNGAGLASKFNYPGQITCDGPNLYVADTQNQVYRKIVISSGVTSTFLGIGPNAFGDDDSSTPSLIQSPTGVYYSNSGLFLLTNGRVDIMR